ncbi:YetF domain-containing protein [Bacillus sp. FJAT-53711]|uniref:YetF domain-containing protein n=1 Tax=Bacillus yunxiaonensis TaxID=3127665 RepID=A0ABU8FSQ9_9BACI
MNIVLESMILIATGVIVLKFAGSKSLSQMSRAEIIIVVSIGRIIVEPVLNKKIGLTILAACIFSGILLIIHYLEMKSRKVEQFLNGDNIVLIKDGELLKNNLKRAKMTEQQLFMHLRVQGIHDIQTLQQVTAEPNGRIGYQLTAQAQPVTREVLEKVLRQYISKE